MSFFSHGLHVFQKRLVVQSTGFFSSRLTLLFFESVKSNQSNTRECKAFATGATFFLQ